MNDYTVIWDGTSNRPMGRMLSALPEPSPLRRIVCAVEAEARVTPPANVARVQRAWRCGPVYAARDRIWALLEFPCTVREIMDLLQLKKNPLSSMITRAYSGGILVPAGSRKNETRRPGVGYFSNLYMRAPQYAKSTTWPYVPMTRTQRRARTQDRGLDTGGTQP